MFLHVQWRIWADDNDEYDSPEVNVSCALAKDCVMGPFFLAECVIKTDNYIDTLAIYYSNQWY